MRLSADLLYLLSDHLPITLVVEKVFREEIACGDGRRLPPFILSCDDTVSHTLRADLICHSRDADHRLGSLVVTRTSGRLATHTI